MAADRERILTAVLRSRKSLSSLFTGTSEIKAWLKHARRQARGDLRGSGRSEQCDWARTAGHLPQTRALPQGCLLPRLQSTRTTSAAAAGFKVTPHPFDSPLEGYIEVWSGLGSLARFE